MKERPILFSGPMVRALLEGRKTQTRRVVKLPHSNPLGQWEPTTIGGLTGGRTKDGQTIPEQGAIWHTRTGDCLMCPYGAPGDRLWVRETFSTDFRNHYPFDDVWYAADDDRRNEIEVRDGVKGIYSPEHREHVPFRWRPSIHMPRAASRITLEITSVRAERLHDISEADAANEGLHMLPASGRYVVQKGEQYFGGADRDARVVFADLWDRINGAGAWDVNPWVWAVTFTVIKATGEKA
ncbi:hypothetical protein [Caballeronia zhejiangensis]|uniref:Morphogenetic protein n=1 Tax=Caballeronia zhejiangensis TaxID=871203 RepID=A0A656Q8X4_9BURK|nr:hypothetical protein [Caballeronia zhejiangensis]KDR25451.1 hypothetical protein BG60_28450 [Caballeronia zhejiangensis]